MASDVSADMLHDPITYALLCFLRLRRRRHFACADCPHPLIRHHNTLPVCHVLHPDTICWFFISATRPDNPAVLCLFIFFSTALTSSTLIQSAGPSLTSADILWSHSFSSCRSCSNRSISRGCLHSSKPSAQCSGTDGQTYRRSPDHYINPAPRTTWAAAVTPAWET